MCSALKGNRVAHSTVTAAAHMDAIYRYQRYIYDASRKYYLLGRDRLLDELEVPEGGTVLEVACGTGRNLIKAARRYPDAKLYGFDISQEMLASARASIMRAGYADRVSVAKADASNFSGEQLFNIPTFDRVVVSYALSMIPPWRRALEQAMMSVAHGGAIYIVDFGAQGELPTWFKAGLRAWLANFSVEPRDDFDDELKRVASRHGLAVHSECLYRGYATYAVVTKATDHVSGPTTKRLQKSLVR